MSVEIIDRTKAEALISEQLFREIQQEGIKDSKFMTLAKRLPNMTTGQATMPVLESLPIAYWVSGDNGTKGVSAQEWDGVTLTAKELAVIVPIPEAVLDDADYDIEAEVIPRIKEAMAKRIDAAILADDSNPWSTSIADIAEEVELDTGDDLYEKLLGEGGLFAAVEDYGYNVSGVISKVNMKAKLRGVRTDDGYPIFKNDMQGATQYALDGAPMYFDELNALGDQYMLAGDWSKAVYSIRQDITTKILTEGVIQDPTDGSIAYNLAQQDMIAIRVVMRMGFALPNPVTYLNETTSGGTVTRHYPFAKLVPAE